MELRIGYLTMRLEEAVQGMAQTEVIKEINGIKDEFKRKLPSRQVSLLQDIIKKFDTLRKQQQDLSLSDGEKSDKDNERYNENDSLVKCHIKKEKQQMNTIMGLKNIVKEPQCNQNENQSIPDWVIKLESKF